MYLTDIYGTLNLCQTLCWGLYMNYFILYFTAAIRKSSVPFYRESGFWCQHWGWNLYRVKIILANASGLYRFGDLQCFLTLEPVLLKSKLFLKHYTYSAAAAAAKSLQSCPTLCDPRDGSPPGSPVPGILQARTLKWVAVFLQCMKVKSESEVVQSCLTPSDPMDFSPPGSSVHGIFQARVLEWGAIAFSAYILCCCSCWVASVVSNSVRPHRRQPTRLPRPWDSPGKSTGVGCHCLLRIHTLGIIKFP